MNNTKLDTMNVPILTYHLVTDAVDLGFARTSLRQFRLQMAWLHENGYQTVTLTESKKQQQAEQAAPNSAKHIALTFDDAYASTDQAAEIMARYGFVGTCFAISEYIGKFNDWDYQFYARKWRHADEHQLRALLQAGWEVGSHSCRHRFLARLPMQKLTEELANSKAQISELVGAPVDTVSYPFGYADPRICQVARACGYQYGVGLGLPVRKQISFGNMCLPRLGIYIFDTMLSFRKKIAAFARPSLFHFAVQQCISLGGRGTVLLKS